MQPITTTWKWILLMVAALALVAAIYIPGRHYAHAAPPDTAYTTDSPVDEASDYQKPSPFTLPPAAVTRRRVHAPAAPLPLPVSMPRDASKIIPVSEAGH